MIVKTVDPTCSAERRPRCRIHSPEANSERLARPMKRRFTSFCLIRHFGSLASMAVDTVSPQPDFVRIDCYSTRVDWLRAGFAGHRFSR